MMASRDLEHIEQKVQGELPQGDPQRAAVEAAVTQCRAHPARQTEGEPTWDEESHQASVSEARNRADEGAWTMCAEELGHGGGGGGARRPLDRLKERREGRGD